MKPTLPNYQDSQVLIVGDIMLDQYWHGSTGRISPEAPVPVVKVAPSGDEVRAGGAANVAMNVAALGGQAKLIGLAGNDAAKDDLLDILSGLAIESDLAISEINPTIKKLRVLSRSQQLIRVDFEEPFTAAEQKSVSDKMFTQAAHAGVVILSDYAKGALAEAPAMIQYTRQVGVPVFVDPKGNNFERYRGATLLTPNMSEFECVVGAVHSDQELIDKGLDLIERYDLTALLVTRSEHGMTLLQKDREPFHLATQAKEVYDVTGAGDTVISVLAASVAAGSSLEEACVLANAAAGVVVGKLGTSTLSDIELAEAIYGSQDLNFGVMPEAALLKAVKAAQRKGEKVVMTNGCFDILHAGHVSYLNHAAQLGDRLIVAVNTDESVKRLKGENRPINHTDRRMAVLSSLGAVDWVVPFSEDTPQRLIANILPDLLVKGGDYQVADIAGGAEVIAAGGAVKVLNFEDGCSTTEIIKLIQNQK